MTLDLHLTVIMGRLESDQAARGIKSIDKVLIRKGIGKPETIKVPDRDNPNYTK